MLVGGLYVCAVTLGGCRCPALPFDPISLVLAQRNGVEPPKKSAFLPRRLHHSRERSCLGGRYSSSPDLGEGAGACRGWVRVRRYAGRWSLACPAIRPHFFCLAKRNGVEPPKKSALKPPHYLGGPTRLSHSALSPNGTNWCVKLVYARLVNRPGKVSLTQSAVMLGLCVRGRGGRDRTAPVAASKARFFGAPPRFFAQEQRNGVELAVGATIHLPRKRRTRTSPKQPPAPPPSRAKMSKDD